MDSLFDWLSFQCVCQKCSVSIGLAHIHSCEILPRVLQKIKKQNLLWWIKLEWESREAGTTWKNSLRQKGEYVNTDIKWF